MEIVFNKWDGVGMRALYLQDSIFINRKIAFASIKDLGWTVKDSNEQSLAYKQEDCFHMVTIVKREKEKEEDRNSLIVMIAYAIMQITIFFFILSPHAFSKC